MDLKENNLAMISTVNQALGELAKEVVYVGGSVVALYIDEKGAPEPAPSVDVDFIIEVASRNEYDKVREKLRSKGFKETDPEDDSDPIPLCRMYFSKLQVDVMPTKESILGFSSPFYESGMKNKILTKLPDGSEVYILDVAHFIATKLSAFLNRGINDLLSSQDLEDLVAIFDGCTYFEEEIKKSNNKVQEYIKKNFKLFIDDWDDIYREAFEAQLADDPKTEKALAIKSKLESIVRI